MIVDTSVVVAILRREPDAPDLVRRVARARVRLMSAVGYLEAGLVMGARLGPAGLEDVDRLIARARIGIEPFDGDQAIVARRAFMDYGKGRHPAGLNFGDCAAYALAVTRGMPLLFKGGDFSLTDVQRA